MIATVLGALRPSLREQTVLELQFDGPVPAYALCDLRRVRPATMVLSRLSDVEVVRWLAVAQSNLKGEQRALSATRHMGKRALKRWRLKQCIAARTEWQALLAEAKRRSAVH